MRVVADTNILVRAVSQNPASPAFAVLNALLGPNHELCLSDYIIEEVIRVLRYPRLQKINGLTDRAIIEYVVELQSASCCVNLSGRAIAPVVDLDPNDDPIVATAVETNASVICTLDRHLYRHEVAKYCSARDIRILSDVELLPQLAV